MALSIQPSRAESPALTDGEDLAELREVLRQADQAQRTGNTNCAERLIKRAYELLEAILARR